MATTKGYHGYHGRGSLKKVLLCVISLTVLLGAIAYLVIQNYVVYDDDGTAHLELPLRHKQKNEPQPVDPGDVELEILTPEKPERPPLAEIHASEVPYGALWWDKKYVLPTAPEDMVIEIKRQGGGITFVTSVEQAPYFEPEPTLSNLKILLDISDYTVARLSCFRDGLFAEDDPTVALMDSRGKRWHDADGYAWVDPASPAMQEYLTALAVECASLGFEEIMLDYFSYPTTGNWQELSAIQNADKEQVLADAVAAIRKSLPEDVLLSTTLRSEISADYGLSEAFLLENFDRVYVDCELDPTPLQNAAQDASQVVPMVYEAAAQGSYYKISTAES